MHAASSAERVLVTGASGLLGLTFCLGMYRRFELHGLVHRHPLVNAPFMNSPCDLSRPGAFSRQLDQFQPDWVLHTAAQANLEACEKDPALSQRLNAELPGEIAEQCARRGIALTHISSDAVFDGQQGGYREDDAPNPQSTYARHKLAGEQAVLAAFPQAQVARVVFYGWSLSGTRSLSEFFVNHLKTGESVRGFTDVIFCPLLADVLAETLVEMRERQLQGVYHVVSRECLSKYQFGVNIARQFGFDPRLVRPVSVNEGGLTARRSPDLTLSTARLEQALGHPMPGQAEMLARFHSQHEDGLPERVRMMGEAAR